MKRKRSSRKEKKEYIQEICLAMDGLAIDTVKQDMTTMTMLTKEERERE